MSVVEMNEVIEHVDKIKPLVEYNGGGIDSLLDKSDETQALVQDMKWSSVEDILEQKRVSVSKTVNYNDKAADTSFDYLEAGDPGIPYEVFIDMEAERILIESFSFEIRGSRYYSDRADYASYLKIQIDDVVREYGAVPITPAESSYWTVKLLFNANGSENEVPLPDTFTLKTAGTKTYSMCTEAPIACKKFKVWIAPVRMSTQKNNNNPYLLKASAAFVKDKEMEE